MFPHRCRKIPFKTVIVSTQKQKRRSLHHDHHHPSKNRKDTYQNSHCFCTGAEKKKYHSKPSQRPYRSREGNSFKAFMVSTEAKDSIFQDHRCSTQNTCQNYCFPTDALKIPFRTLFIYTEAEKKLSSKLLVFFQTEAGKLPFIIITASTQK